MLKNAVISSVQKKASITWARNFFSAEKFFNSFNSIRKIQKKTFKRNQTMQTSFIFWKQSWQNSKPSLTWCYENLSVKFTAGRHSATETGQDLLALLNKTYPIQFWWHLLASPAREGVQWGDSPLLGSWNTTKGRCFFNLQWS